MSHVYRRAVVLSVVGLSLLASSRASTYFFPQIAVGSSGGLRIQTLVTVSNPSTNVLNATVVLGTADDNGLEWPVTWEARGRSELSGTKTWFEVALSPGETITMLAHSSGPVTTGWMRGLSSLPVVLTVRYSVATGTGTALSPQWEVGVLPSAASNEHFLFVGEGSSDWPGSTTGTALAMANTAYDASTVTLELYPMAGFAPISTKTVAIPAGGHLAKFITEVFNDVSFAPLFRGMLRISANTALAVVTLQKWEVGSTSIYSSAGTVPFHGAATNLCFEDEPSDSPGLGPVISLPGEAVGTLSSPSDGIDTDFFRVYLQSGQSLAVVALGRVLGSSLAPEISVLSPSPANVVLATGTSFLPDFGESALQVTVQETGFYGLRIRSPSSSHGRQLFYRLFLGRK